MEENPSNNGTSESDDLSSNSEDIVQVDQEDISIRSTEVQEIIGRPPHWLVRGGISGFLGVLVLILVAASVIKYPEVITAPLRLRAINEPKTLESTISGKIVRLSYDNNVQVAKDDILVWLESTANHKAVLELSTAVDSMYQWLQKDNLNQIRSFQIARFSDLGELQTNFQTFEQAYRTFVTYLPGDFYSQKQKMLQQEIKYTRQLLEKLNEQKKIQKINYRIARHEYETQKKLAAKDLVAPIDLAKAESKVANSRLPMQQTESAIINNHASQATTKQKLMELNKEITDQESIFQQALNTFKSAIEQWKTKYFIRTPIRGQLVYAGIIQENQTVEAGQRIAYIQPENTRFFGEMIISQRSFGKIREGQNVLVRFNGYPDQEFGSVMGNVDYLSEFPVQDSVFLAKVNFPNGLKTNYGQKLPPTNGMTGQAEIITQDMRFLERIYNNLTKDLR